MVLNRLQLSLYQQAGTVEINTIIVDVWWVDGTVKVSSCQVAIIRHSGRRLGCKHRGAVVIHGEYCSFEVNKSIVISIIDRNIYRWVRPKRWFSEHDQERRPIRSVASDCLTNIHDTVSLNVIQKYRKEGRKIAFTIKIEIEAEGLSHPKSKEVFTVLRCPSCPDLVILAWTGDKLSCGQAQYEV